MKHATVCSLLLWHWPVWGPNVCEIARSASGTAPAKADLYSSRCVCPSWLFVHPATDTQVASESQCCRQGDWNLRAPAFHSLRPRTLWVGETVMWLALGRSVTPFHGYCTILCFCHLCTITIVTASSPTPVIFCVFFFIAAILIGRGGRCSHPDSLSFSSPLNLVSFNEQL